MKVEESLQNFSFECLFLSEMFKVKTYHFPSIGMAYLHCVPSKANPETRDLGTDDELGERSAGKSRKPTYVTI